jgi:hypothetical protein
MNFFIAQENSSLSDTILVSEECYQLLSKESPSPSIYITIVNHTNNLKYTVHVNSEQYTSVSSNMYIISVPKWILDILHYHPDSDYIRMEYTTIHHQAVTICVKSIENVPDYIKESLIDNTSFGMLRTVQQDTAIPITYNVNNESRTSYIYIYKIEHDTICYLNRNAVIEWTDTIIPPITIPSPGSSPVHYMNTVRNASLPRGPRHHTPTHMWNNLHSPIFIHRPLPHNL